MTEASLEITKKTSEPLRYFLISCSVIAVVIVIGVLSDDLAPIAMAISLGSITVIWASNHGLKNIDPSEVYSTWYLFSLNLFLFYAIFDWLLVEKWLVPKDTGYLGVSIDQQSGVVGSLVQVFIEASSSVKGQLYFSAFLFSAIVIPQIVGFLLGGIFGCGRRPVFLEDATEWAVSLFSHGCGAIAALELCNAIFSVYLYSPEKIYHALIKVMHGTTNTDSSAESEQIFAAGHILEHLVTCLFLAAIDFFISLAFTIFQDFKLSSARLGPVKNFFLRIVARMSVYSNKRSFLLNSITKLVALTERELASALSESQISNDKLANLKLAASLLEIASKRLADFAREVERRRAEGN